MEPHVVEEKISPLPGLAAAPPLPHDEEGIAGRTVAFPDAIHVHVHEEKHSKPITKGGVEMKRTLTQEERELAEAGYGHLHQHIKGQKVEDEDAQKDIQEHKLTVELLRQEMDVSFDVKDPARSAGLSPEEAKARLGRDGPNVLTPPKKKSGLRKVCL
jgi:sodium/potassium-transporting ATPase subunit alpha